MMSTVELIPLNKGKQVILDNATTTTIGRTPNIGCLDKKISRHHAELFIKPDGTVWIKSIHHNPTFYKTKTNEIVSLTRNKEYQLFDNDQFGLLPNEYFYRVSIKLKDEEKEINSNQNQTDSSSTIPSSPIKENEILTIENHDDEEKEINSSTIPKSPIKENHDEDKSQSTLDKNRALPNWMSDSLPATSASEEKTTSTSLVRKRIHPEESKKKQIVFGDSDDEMPSTTAASTAQTTTSNDVNLDVASQVSSTVDVPTKRQRCPYGETCYRKNPIHRQEAIHPGDSDWEDEDDEKTKAKPVCPYGNKCYRTNTDHLNEYEHPKKRCIELKTKQRSTKRKVDEEDDDGLPNEYDHNDSFIDDEDLGTTDESSDEEETDDDIEWKPKDKHSRHLNETDDDSTDDSDKELTKKEAEEFVKGSSSSHNGSVTKKPRVDDE